jgi:hypothetical protein
MRKKKPPSGRPEKHSHAVLRDILDALIEKPHTAITDVARRHKISRVSVYVWSARSVKDKEAGLLDVSPFYFEYLGQPGYFSDHMNLVRRLSILQIDAKVREAAIKNHRVPLVNLQTGKPLWRVDPQLAAEALDPLNWVIMYGDRPITDVYARDENGALIQEYEEKPPNPQILLRAAAALLPDQYGEHISHSVQIGGVLKIGASTPSQSTAQAAIDADFALIGADAPKLKEATNVLAIAERPKTIEEYDETFVGKRMIEIVPFYDEAGKLEAPQEQWEFVFGSPMHRLYADAGFAVKAVQAEKLLAEGYNNSFLKKLALKVA